MNIFYIFSLLWTVSSVGEAVSAKGGSSQFQRVSVAAFFSHIGTFCPGNARFISLFVLRLLAFVFFSPCAVVYLVVCDAL